MFEAYVSTHYGFQVNLSTTKLMEEIFEEEQGQVHYQPSSVIISSITSYYKRPIGQAFHQDDFQVLIICSFLQNCSLTCYFHPKIPDTNIIAAKTVFAEIMFVSGNASQLDVAEKHGGLFIQFLGLLNQRSTGDVNYGFSNNLIGGNNVWVCALYTRRRG
ncbi:hypothetical protein AMECASPLE_026961 [Ameca splendens]|uniref:Uncharacterized protein n=1 Tax=Ameca splendens TaxID=208324 RepID=A0ABV0ZDY7_9TELE